MIINVLYRQKHRSGLCSSAHCWTSTPSGAERGSSRQNLKFTHFLLCALLTEARVTFSDPRNRYGVSQRERIPPCPPWTCKKNNNTLKINLAWLHTACVVSYRCPGGSTAQFDSKGWHQNVKQSVKHGFNLSDDTTQCRDIYFLLLIRGTWS